MPGDLQAQFSERFGGTSGLYRAPGRVNLIGEHTDYNQGYVMPVAIGLSCWVAIGPRDDRKLAIYSEDLDESAELAVVYWEPSSKSPSSVAKSFRAE
jgi:galactokinase